MKKGEKAANEAAQNEESTMDLTAIEIVDQDSAEVMVLPAAFMVERTEGIRMLTNAREWRAMTDKAAGYFDANGDNMGSTMKMNLLNYRMEKAFFGVQYGEDEMDVVQAVFIDQDKVVSNIVFMKSAAEEFKKMLDNIMLKQLPPVAFDITATMEKKTTKAGFAYHLVTFKAEKLETSKLKEILDFVKANGRALQAFKDLPRK